MVKKIRTVIKYTLYLVISLVFGIAMYLGSAKAITGNAMPTPFGYGVGVVVSGSMEPSLSIDDVIIVKKRDVYYVHDVVVYQSKGMLVVHEIIEIDGDYVITKGSANNEADAPVPIKNIKGEVIKVYEGAGNYIKFLKSPGGTVTILAVALLLLILSLQGEKKDDKKEINELKKEIERLKNNN